MKNEAVSNRNTIQRARFRADGSMAWEAEDGSGAYVTREGDEWKYVRRSGMMGGTTAPGSCLQARDPQPPSPSRAPLPPSPSLIPSTHAPAPVPTHPRSCQFRHVMPRAGYEELGELADAPVAYTLPAMRVYRVPRGWVLRSSHDTFTSFARDMRTFVPQRRVRQLLDSSSDSSDEEEEYGGPPKFTWSLWALRKQLDKLDKRHTDSIDRDWLDAEQAIPNPHPHPKGCPGWMPSRRVPHAASAARPPCHLFVLTYLPVHLPDAGKFRRRLHQPQR